VTDRTLPNGSSTTAPCCADRRAFIRYPRTLDTLWQLLGLGPRDVGSGRVFDLSASGIGLVFERSFRVGTRLVIRLATVAHGWNSFLVTVQRCDRAAEGGFEVGCAFTRELRPDELRDLLV
jgi:hypothetical protein